MQALIPRHVVLCPRQLLLVLPSQEAVHALFTKQTVLIPKPGRNASSAGTQSQTVIASCQAVIASSPQAGSVSSPQSGSSTGSAGTHSEAGSISPRQVVLVLPCQGKVQAVQVLFPRQAVVEATQALPTSSRVLPPKRKEYI